VLIVLTMIDLSGVGENRPGDPKPVCSACQSPL